MKTPICDFVLSYANKNSIRAHMPGHKGMGFDTLKNGDFSVESLDITEINGADVLYHSTGIISKSQAFASKLFRSGKTVYSVEGSSLSIRAMVYLTKIFALSNNKKPLILAPRNAHKSFVTSCAVLDVDVAWISGGENILSCKIDLAQLENTLKKTSPTAVYITSPDYLGNTADIKAISELCKKHNTLLLVDNAHGAYLTFLDKSSHPIDLGADLCADSAHKTLPVLTGGAYLHIGKNAPKLFFDQAENAMSIFASTSPSYLILQSLDKINGSFTEIKKDIKALVPKISVLKNSLISAGYSLLGNEPLKVTICPKSYGYTGLALEKILQKHNIFCEFADKDFLVLMFSCKTQENELSAVANVLLNLKKHKAITELPPKPAICKQIISPNQAIFALSKEIDASDALGKILASPTVSCPPAIPIVVCGEEINETAIALLKYYNIEKCVVVDN